MRAVIASLEENQAALAGSDNREATQLIAMAALQLRMRLHQIGDSELKALCDAILPETATDSDLPEASSCL